MGQQTYLAGQIQDLPCWQAAAPNLVVVLDQADETLARTVLDGNADDYLIQAELTGTRLRHTLQIRLATAPASPAGEAESGARYFLTRPPSASTWPMPRGDFCGLTSAFAICWATAKPNCSSLATRR
ncbi:MAG: hypothetical protein HC922_02075 [Leptolyngbyaceae cyanobacterium SM2_3_12]|nr:hypothetical protein [Leptolyngbyaceae cyanobacterium SM2_3_12]